MCFTVSKTFLLIVPCPKEGFLTFGTDKMLQKQMQISNNKNSVIIYSIKYMQNCLSYHLCWLLLAVELSDIQINVMKHLIIIILLKLTLVSIRVSIQR